VTVIPSGYAQANFKFGGTGAPNGAEVTLGLELAGVLQTPSGVAADLIANWVATVHTVLPGSITLDSVLVKFGPVATGPSADVAAGDTGTGGGTGTSPNVAILVHKVTPLGGRAGRGRMYIPGVQESEVDTSGNLTTPFVTGINAELATFWSTLNSDDTPPVILHNVGSPLTTPTPITDFNCDPRVATQRRRLRG
jgi:hypothetical protein